MGISKSIVGVLLIGSLTGFSKASFAEGCSTAVASLVQPQIQLKFNQARLNEKTDIYVTKGSGLPAIEGDSLHFASKPGLPFMYVKSASSAEYSVFRLNQTFGLNVPIAKTARFIDEKDFQLHSVDLLSTSGILLALVSHKVEADGEQHLLLSPANVTDPKNGTLSILNEGVAKPLVLSGLKGLSQISARPNSMEFWITDTSNKIRRVALKVSMKKIMVPVEEVQGQNPQGLSGPAMPDEDEGMNEDFDDESIDDDGEPGADETLNIRKGPNAPASPEAPAVAIARVLPSEQPAKLPVEESGPKMIAKYIPSRFDVVNAGEQALLIPGVAETDPAQVESILKIDFFPDLSVAESREERGYVQYRSQAGKVYSAPIRIQNEALEVLWTNAIELDSAKSSTTAHPEEGLVYVSFADRIEVYELNAQTLELNKFRQFAATDLVKNAEVRGIQFYYELESDRPELKGFLVTGQAGSEKSKLVRIQFRSH